jgi:hypothetical protein
MRIKINGEEIHYTDKKKFGTAQEANAFREGVEYANDSALSVVDIIEDKGQYSVLLYDEDRA